MLQSEHVVIQIAEDKATGGLVTLCPLDVANLGSAVPMIWYYPTTLDSDRLLLALKATLAEYPVLSGRYVLRDGDGGVPVAIELNNGGVPVHVCEVATAVRDAFAHVPTSGSAVSVFALETNETLLPAKKGMHPDPCSAECPLLKLKITRFAEGGSAIGSLALHGAVDASAQIQFLIDWSRVYRGLPPDSPPDHERIKMNRLTTSAVANGEALPNNLRCRAVPPGEQAVPEFAPLLPKLSGNRAVVVPLPRARLDALVAAARAALPDGGFISSDDVVTALVWRAMTRLRTTQLDVAADSNEPTTLFRAVNARAKTEPKLGRAFFGNAAFNVPTESTVREVCSMGVTELALKLRGTIREQTPEAIAARLQWYVAQQEKGCRTPPAFDANGFSFLVSSWLFDWEGADFGSTPACFDHGALRPFITVFTPRPQGDGISLWFSGTDEACELFGRLMMTAEET